MLHPQAVAPSDSCTLTINDSYRLLVSGRITMCCTTSDSDYLTHLTHHCQLVSGCRYCTLRRNLPYACQDRANPLYKTPSQGRLKTVNYTRCSTTQQTLSLRLKFVIRKKSDFVIYCKTLTLKCFKCRNCLSETINLYSTICLYRHACCPSQDEGFSLRTIFSVISKAIIPQQ